MILRERMFAIIDGASTEFYGAMIPLNTKESWELGLSPETINYRAILPPTIGPADIPNAADTIRWLGSNYAMVGPCLRFHANGQLHHLEAYVTR